LHSFAKMHLDWLDGVVRDGVEQGQFTIGDQRPRDVAAQIAAGIQGALLVGRLSSDRHVLTAVARDKAFFGLRAQRETLILREGLERRPADSTPFSLMAAI
jgi:hypothetical protein